MKSTFLSFSLFTAIAAAQVQSGAFEVSNGIAEFTAATNISAVTVHGKSNQLSAHVTVTENGQQLTLQDVGAELDVASLTTGMGLRDRHMREKIFTVGGQMPKIRFSAGQTTCAMTKGQPTSCVVSGTLGLRNTTRPVQIAMKVRPDGQNQYKVTGESKIRLSDFGIEAPSQLGIRMLDEVSLKLDFTAHNAPGAMAKR